jgi:hypothetical protein
MKYLFEFASYFCAYIWFKVLFTHNVLNIGLYTLKYGDFVKIISVLIIYIIISSLVDAITDAVVSQSAKPLHNQDDTNT